MRRFFNIVLIISLLAVGGCSISYPPTDDKQEYQVTNKVSPADLSNYNKKYSNKENLEKTELENEKKPVDEQIKSAEDEVNVELINAKKIELLVTQDFGRETIFNKFIPFKEDDNLLYLMQQNMDIDTSYGGGFVSSINGIKMRSGAKSSDWFFYVNGILSHTGIGDYELSDNDKIMWDYHLWSAGPTNNAIIGLYPAPFYKGYRGSNNPTTILYDELSLELAEKLAFSLEGLGVKVNTNLINATDIKDQPTIVIGKWADLADNETLKNLNKAYRKNGLGVHFTEEGLDLLDYKGQVVRSVVDSTAVIVAWGKSIGDANPLWLIVGNDDVALSEAVNILINSPKDIQGLYGIAILPDGNIPLPLR